MFGITAGYHRYFSHRAYKLNRFHQFCLAFLGSTSVQKGVLWWASHHRMHHVYADTAKDIHSPTKEGFWWSHVGWILSPKYEATNWKSISDFAKYPELRFLNRFHLLPVFIYAFLLWYFWSWNGLVWGFFISTLLLWHGTFAINSLAHVIGKVRFPTSDTSRNHWLLAWITLGEGWHNNHHYYMSSARQGFYWWEIDVSYWILKGLSYIGIVKALNVPPKRVLQFGRELNRKKLTNV